MSVYPDTGRDAKDLQHVEELRDAWQRGVFTEHDGKGGTRSNRNMDIDGELYRALAAYTSHVGARKVGSDEK